MPQPQRGEIVTFPRRTPEQSRLPEDATPQQMYDFIRMLDADGYPRAFIQHGDWRCELSNAALDTDGLRADVRLSRAGRSD